MASVSSVLIPEKLSEQNKIMIRWKEVTAVNALNVLAADMYAMTVYEKQII